MKFWKVTPRAMGLGSLVFVLALGLQAATVTGTLVNQANEPLPLAAVRLLELNRETRVEADGRFSFKEVPAGTYTLQILTDRFGSLLKTIEVPTKGETHHFDLSFDLEVHEDLTVTASLRHKSISDVSQAVGVMGEAELHEELQPTLGETLANQPGISSTYFGPGASRPVIRGLGGDRIRVLEGGMGNGDVSTTSVDHAVTVDSMATERIEILRGPASLRYGPNAVGGVVNVIDGRIPEFLPSGPIEGEVLLSGDSAADMTSFGVNLNGAVQKLAWHVDYSKKETEDLDIPGFAEQGHGEEDHGEEEEEEVEGTLENSAIDNNKATAGISYITDRGFIGVSFTNLENNYGIPGHGHHEEHEDEHGEEEEEEEEEERVTIDLEQKRFDIRGGWNMSGDVLKGITVRLAQTDYEHTELEGDEIGTVFENEFLELRAESLWEPKSDNQLAIGVQYSERDFSAQGEEAFVPPNETEKLGLFAYSEWDRETWSFTLGARIDRQNNQGTELLGHHGEEEEEEEPRFFDIDNTSLSFSAGMVFGRQSPYGAAFNVTRTERAPTAEELFSNGPHLATNTFEIGNPELNEEQSLGLDVVLRKKEGRVTGELNLFHNDFSDFIFEQFTGEEEDGLNEARFLQEDATFYGAEFHVDANLLHSEPHHLDLELTYDLVRADLDRSGNLPRITPDRFGVDLRYSHHRLWARLGADFVSKQDRIGAFETATDSYTHTHASLGYTFLLGRTVHRLLLRGTNLGDEEGRNHVSFLKDRAPLPGRNITFSYRIGF